MRGLAWWMCLVLLGGLFGCQLHQLPSTPPDTPPTKEQVLQAASAVIRETYPMSVPVEQSRLVLARTPVELMGAAKTRRSISVFVQQNRTGAWEPRVRVVLEQEYEEPSLAVEQTAESPYGGSPVGTERWRALQNLPVEEKRIADEILARIQI